MNASPETIGKLFRSGISIRIPAYQRAYSWEEKQCKQFLEDLIEQKAKQYYLGQFLFEIQGSTLFIIDGQQRLTTTILFLAAIARIKNEAGEKTEDIRDSYLTDVFKTIDDDQLIFKRVTQKYRISIQEDTETLSQRRIISAFNYFDQELRKLDRGARQLVQETLEKAVISTFYISNKVEASQVFEYQNNRGKELSRFEVIKAYLMHQLYLQSDGESQANEDISEIQPYISKAYRSIEAVEGYFTEYDLLENYCFLYYKINGNVDSIKEELNKQVDKRSWIKRFFEDFSEIANSAKSIVKNKDKPCIANLFFVGNEANWKLVLLALFIKGENSGATYERILKLLEVLCFKLKLGDFRTDYLPRFAGYYFEGKEAYNLSNLYLDIKAAAETGFKWYWNAEDRFQKIIVNKFENEKYHYEKGMIKFVLWQYENDIRIRNSAGALLDKDQYEAYTIEHICPQNPENEQYPEAFKENYLHLAGNLALLTQSQNSRFSNKSFSEKSELFQDTALSCYTEIREKKEWGEHEIQDRHTKISTFVQRYFDTTHL